MTSSWFFYSSVTKVDRKYLESFEMWYWRRMEKVSWTDLLRNEEVLWSVKEVKNIIQTTKRRKANWISYILGRNCFLKYIVEGKIEGRIEVAGRHGRRRKQLLADLNEKSVYWKLKEEALDHTLLRNFCGRGCHKTDNRMMNFIHIILCNTRQKSACPFSSLLWVGGVCVF